MISTLLNPINRLARWWLGYTDSDKVARDFGARKAIYDVNRMMYDGTVYYSRANGGCLEDILRTYCGATNGKGRIIPHFLPAREIVDFYAACVMPGMWNGEIRPVLPDGGDIDQAFHDSLTTVWRDSNLDSEKARIIRLNANLGTVGFRIVRLQDSDRVVIQADEPERLFNVEEDAAGNVVSVVLKYTQPFNFGTSLEPDFQDVEYIEVFNKDEFSKKIDGKEQLPADSIKNPFGFCPYVVNRHKDNGTIFGDHAYKGSEAQIHDINWRITQQGRSINRHQFPNWFFTAGGKEPSPMDMGEEKAWYVQSKEGTPPPSAEAIVPKIDQAAATDYGINLRNMLRSHQPELNFNDVQLLSGLSGESIAQVLKPSEAAVLSVRPNYDHAFVRAMQMAVSIRADLGLESALGTDGDALYKAGKLAFSFADRPALPQTVFQKQQQATAETATDTARANVAKAFQGIGASAKTVLLKAGFTPEEADAELAARARTDPTLDTTL